MTGSHFARWARRKAAAKQAPARIAADPAASFHALPDVADITAQTDIRGFLQPDVPAALRKAALRRAWLVDPMVRDFAGPARDYDFDWTRPEGLPAGGALAAPQDDAVPILTSDVGRKGIGDA